MDSQQPAGNASEHRLRRVDRHHPSKTFTGKLKGGAIFGCTGCPWTVVTGGTLQGIKAHAQHVRDLDKPVEAEPADADTAEAAG